MVSVAENSFGTHFHTVLMHRCCTQRQACIVDQNVHLQCGLSAVKSLHCTLLCQGDMAKPTPAWRIINSFNAGLVAAEKCSPMHACPQMMEGSKAMQCSIFRMAKHAVLYVQA